MAENLTKLGCPVQVAVTTKLDVKVFAVLGQADDWAAYGMILEGDTVPNHAALSLHGWKVSKEEAVELFPALNPATYRNGGRL